MLKKYKKRAKKYAKNSKTGKITRRFVISFIPGSLAEKRFLRRMGLLESVYPEGYD